MIDFEGFWAAIRWAIVMMPMEWHQDCSCVLCDMKKLWED